MVYLVGHGNCLTALVTSKIVYTIKVRKIQKM